MIFNWEQHKAVGVLLKQRLKCFLLFDALSRGWLDHFGLVHEWYALDGDGDLVTLDVLLIRLGNEHGLLDGSLHLEVLNTFGSL